MNRAKAIIMTNVLTALVVGEARAEGCIHSGWIVGAAVTAERQTQKIKVNTAGETAIKIDDTTSASAATKKHRWIMGCGLKLGYQWKINSIGIIRVYTTAALPLGKQKIKYYGTKSGSDRITKEESEIEITTKDKYELGVGVHLGAVIKDRLQIYLKYEAGLRQTHATIKVTGSEEDIKKYYEAGKQKEKKTKLAHTVGLGIEFQATPALSAGLEGFYRIKRTHKLPSAIYVESSSTAGGNVTKHVGQSMGIALNLLWTI
ncbi:MAG: hypothetical protein LBF56_01220 [Holosporales bacterium]|jgi:opacity protein-like surface antigen|nr:hypothetical protein [Holosporales bacterium]